MINITIDIYVDLDNNTMRVWRNEPNFGASRKNAQGARQYGVLNNGTHRVKFAVFNATLPLDLIKSTARMALSARPEAW